MKRRRQLEPSDLELNLLVPWTPRWHNFVTNIRPAFQRKERPLAGEVAIGFVPCMGAGGVAAIRRDHTARKIRLLASDVHPTETKIGRHLLLGRGAAPNRGLRRRSQRALGQVRWTGSVPPNPSHQSSPRTEVDRAGSGRTQAHAASLRRPRCEPSGDPAGSRTATFRGLALLSKGRCSSAQCRAGPTGTRNRA